MRLIHSIVVLAVAGTTGCYNIFAENCDIDETSEELAGEGAVDCGVVEDGDDGTDAWACAIDAFESGEAFYIVTGWAGIDTVGHDAFVSDGDRVWRLHQDEEGSGPWRIDGWDCLDPYVAALEDDPWDPDDISGYEVLFCSGSAPVNNHYQVCGECRGCEPPGEPFDP